MSGEDDMTSTDVQPIDDATDEQGLVEPVEKPKPKAKKAGKGGGAKAGDGGKAKPKDKAKSKDKGESPDVAVPVPVATPDGRGSGLTTGRQAAYGAAALVFALLVAAVVVLMVRTVRDHNTIDRQHRLDSARASVLTAAKRYAIDFTTYDYKNLDAGFKRTEAELTGDFKDQYVSTTAALKQTIIKYKAKATSVLQAMAAQSLTPNDAVIIAFVDQTITNATSTTPQVDRVRMQMTLHRSGSGRWLISNLQLP
jgi:Mce-associated membrane protein